MDADEPGWALLDDFFRGEAEDRATATARRYERVRHRLVHYLDTADVADALGTGPAALLEAERQFHEHGAFWILLGPDDLVCCLAGFLEPPWLPAGRAEGQAQVSLVGRLVAHLRRRRLVDEALLGCVLHDTERALARARRRVEGLTELGEDEVVQQQPGRSGGGQQ